MYRSEELELPGGMSMERISATNGTVAWEDQKQRGGMGGGMQVMLAGPGGRELNPAASKTAAAATIEDRALALPRGDVRRSESVGHLGGDR